MTVLLVLNCLCVVPAAYLAVLTIAALLQFARVRSSAGLPAAPGRIAVLIPAHDEADGIVATVDSVLALEDAAVDVHVIADNCTDDTAALARSRGVVVFERNDPSAKSKGHALAWAMPQLLGRYGAGGQELLAVVILDADATISADSVAHARRAFSAGAECLQSGYTLRETNSQTSHITAIAMSAMNIVRGAGRQFFGVSDTLKGNGMWFRTALLVQHPWRAFSLAEDLEYGLLLREHGHRIQFLAGSRVTGLPGTSRKAAANQRARWELGRARLLFSQLPKAMRRLVRRPRLDDLDLILDSLTPPLTYYVLLLVVLAVVTYLVGGSLIPVAAGFGVLSMHAVAGVFLGGHGMRGMVRLVCLPVFLGMRVLQLPTIWAQRRSRAWVRTERNARG